MLVLRAQRLLLYGARCRLLVQRVWCSSKHPDERKGIILGVYQEGKDPVLTKAAESFDGKLKGKLLQWARTSGIHFEPGKGMAFNNIDSEFWAVALVGLGQQNLGYNEMEAIDEGMEAARLAAGKGAQLLMDEKCTRVLTEGLGYPEQAGEGTALGLWRYQENKMRKHWQVIPTLELFFDNDTDAFQRGIFKAESQNIARRLTDTPGNLMTPLHFAQEVVNELCPCGVRVEVHDKDWAEDKKMQAFMAVARGSCEPPIILEISYQGGGAEKILLVGKGITFDSGGLCFKKCRGMAMHRGQNTGAAAIVGAIRSAAALSIPVNLTAVIPLCENMPSGMAMRNGDMVKSLDGRSIRIERTYRAGRLAMADALLYGVAEHSPKLIIDVASSTRCVRRGLGFAASGVYTTTQNLWSQVRRASVITGDRVWRMPLWRYFENQVVNMTSHDVNNKGRGCGHSAIAAAFLLQFTDCIDWIHFDTGGSGLLNTNKQHTYYYKYRMSGRPTRTLTQLFQQLASGSGGKKGEEGSNVC